MTFSSAALHQSSVAFDYGMEQSHHQHQQLPQYHQHQPPYLLHHQEQQPESNNHQRGVSGILLVKEDGKFKTWTERFCRLSSKTFTIESKHQILVSIDLSNAHVSLLNQKPITIQIERRTDKRKFCIRAGNTNNNNNDLLAALSTFGCDMLSGASTATVNSGRDTPCSGRATPSMAIPSPAAATATNPEVISELKKLSYKCYSCSDDAMIETEAEVENMRRVTTLFVGKGSEEIGTHGRKLIKDGWTERCVVGSNSCAQLRLFLFNDCLITAIPIQARRPGWYRWGGEGKVELEDVVSLIECEIKDDTANINEYNTNNNTYKQERKVIRSESINFGDKMDVEQDNTELVLIDDDDDDNNNDTTDNNNNNKNGEEEEELEQECDVSSSNSFSIVSKNGVWKLRFETPEEAAEWKTKIEMTIQSAIETWGRVHVHESRVLGWKHCLVKNTLWSAALDGQDEEVKHIFHSASLNNPLDINCQDEEGITPIHLAAAAGHMLVIHTLVHLRADLNAVDHQHRTPLHLAILSGHSNVVSQLLRLGADPTIPDKSHKTPLTLAITTLTGPESAAVTTALSRQMSSNSLISVNLSPHSPQFSILGLAVSVGSEDAFHSLISIPNLNLNAPANNLGLSPLILAVSASRTVIAAALIEAKASVNGCRMSNGWTPLHIAASNSNFELVGLLLGHGAQPNAVDEMGQTPLHVAKAAPIAQELVRCGARLDIVDNTGKTAYQAASLLAGVDAESLWLQPSQSFFLHRNYQPCNPNAFPGLLSLSYRHLNECDLSLNFEAAMMDDCCSDTCTICSAEFKWTRRRHHCRVCGALVCHSCSTKKIQKKKDEAFVRCCDGCFNAGCTLLAVSSGLVNSSPMRPHAISRRFPALPHHFASTLHNQQPGEVPAVDPRFVVKSPTKRKSEPKIPLPLPASPRVRAIRITESSEVLLSSSPSLLLLPTSNFNNENNNNLNEEARRSSFASILGSSSPSLFARLNRCQSSQASQQQQPARVRSCSDSGVGLLKASIMNNINNNNNNNNNCGSSFTTSSAFKPVVVSRPEGHLSIPPALRPKPNFANRKLNFNV